MVRATISVWAIACALLFAAGCTTIDPPRAAGLSQPPPGLETVALEVFSIRATREQAADTTELWNRVDEQQLPADARRHLAENGFRAGVIGSQLPPTLEKLMATAAAPASTSGAVNQITDFEQQPLVRQRYLQTLAGRRTKLICTGEHARHEQLAVLVRGGDGQVHGRTYRQVMGLLSARAYPVGDGRVRLELTPELEHGEARRRFEPSEGALKIEFSPPQEKFDLLRIVATLAPGQMLLVSARPDLPGTLGYQFFMEPLGDRAEQKLLVIRLARARYDDLFNAEPGASAPSEL